MYFLTPEIALDEFDTVSDIFKESSYSSNSTMHRNSLPF